MVKQFQFLLTGAILTLLIVLGAFFLSTETQAKNDQVTVSTAIETNTNAPHSENEQKEIAQQLAIERKNLKQKWVKEMEKKSGWLHTRVQYERPDKDYGMLPNGTHIPSDYILETWYLQDSAGAIVSMVNIMWDLEDNMVQYAAVQNGLMYDSGLDSIHESESLRLPWTNNDNDAQPNIIFQEELTTDKNQLVVYSIQDRFSPTRFDDLDGALANGYLTKETINLNSGQLVAEERFILLSDGTEQLLGKFEYLTLEWTEQLPQYAAELLINSELQGSVENK